MFQLKKTRVLPDTYREKDDVWERLNDLSPRTYVPILAASVIGTAMIYSNTLAANERQRNHLQTLDNIRGYIDSEGHFINGRKFAKDIQFQNFVDLCSAFDFSFNENLQFPQRNRTYIKRIVFSDLVDSLRNELTKLQSSGELKTPDGEALRVNLEEISQIIFTKETPETLGLNNLSVRHADSTIALVSKLGLYEKTNTKLQSMVKPLLIEDPKKFLAQD